MSEDRYSAAGGRAPAVIAALLIGATLLNYIDRQMLAVLKPTLSAEFGWSNSDFAHLGSLFQFATALSYIGVGWFLDRFGIRTAYAGGVALWSLAAAAHGFAAHMREFVVARIALAIGESINTPALLKTIATDVKPSLRGPLLAIVNAAPNLGAIATPLIVPPLALMIGWRATFVCVGVLGFAWIAAWLIVRRDGPKEQSKAAPAAGGGWAALTSRPALAIIGAKALFDHVWWFLLFWTPAFFNQTFGLNQAQIGGPTALAFSFAALGALSTGAAPFLLRRLGVSEGRVRPLAMFLYALIILPVGLAAQAGGPWIAACLIGLALFAHQGFSTNVFAFAAERVDAQNMGKVIAAGALAGNLSGMAIIEAAGFSLDQGFGYGPIFAIASVAYFAALAWMFAVGGFRASGQATASAQ